MEGRVWRGEFRRSGAGRIDFDRRQFPEHSRTTAPEACSGSVLLCLISAQNEPKRSRVLNLDPCSFARKAKWRPKSERWLKGTRKTTGKRFTASISSPLADSGTSHTTKKAAENVPRRGYNFYIQLEATPAIMPPTQYWEIIADNFSTAGWSWGYRSVVTRDGWRLVVDAGS